MPRLPSLLLLASLFLAACAPTPEDHAPQATPTGTPSDAPTEATPVPSPPAIALALEGWSPEIRVPGLEDRTFPPEAWWDAVLPLVEASPAWEVEEVGRSAEDRPLRILTFGGGPTTVLLWSQMHGDESTASMALADLVHLLARGDAMAGEAAASTEAAEPTAAAAPTEATTDLETGAGGPAGETPDLASWTRTLAEELTVVLFPVMNPDGAARFQRRNAQGVDLNRDARALSTPEGQALKALQERFRPTFGFNLHDQAVGTRVGRTDRGTAIALLAPPFDATREVNEVRGRAIALSAVIRTALEPRVGGYMARWSDTFNPRAFGDLMTAWGVSTILIESGGWEGDPQKQFLRELNLVALGTSLDAIAHDTWSGADPRLYHELPENGRRFGDLLLRGATLHAPGVAPLTGDLLVNFDHPLAELGGRVADVGDLAETEARFEIDLTGWHLHTTSLLPGADANLRLTLDPEGREVRWEMEGDAEGRRPPPRP